MSWTFRRRIKIADGVQLNLSRGGLSLTLGPRGARVTVSPKASYLHLGLPGTGIYSRTKVWSRRKKALRRPVRKPQASSSGDAYSLDTGIRLGREHNESAERPNRYTEAQSRRGVRRSVGTILLLGLLWVLFGFFVLLFFAHISTMAMEGATLTFVILTLVDAAVAVLLLLYILRRTRRPSALRRRKDGTLELIPDDFIRFLQEETGGECNALRGMILRNFLAKAIREQADAVLRPLIEERMLRLDRRPDKKVQAEMEEYQTLLERRYADAEQYAHDFVGELSGQERERYAQFCEAYRPLRASKKKWLVSAEEENTDSRSSSDTLLTTTELAFGEADFWAMDIPYDYPTIPVSRERRLCFFPRFVVEEDIRSYGDFKVYPIRDVVLLYEECRFHEKEDVPEDAVRIDTTYEYVNEDGSPDKRYAVNAELAVVLYGNISIMPFGYMLQFSNNAAARAFADAYAALVAATPESVVTGDPLPGAGNR